MQPVPKFAHPTAEKQEVDHRPGACYRHRKKPHLPSRHSNRKDKQRHGHRNPEQQIEPPPQQPQSPASAEEKQ